MGCLAGAARWEKHHLPRVGPKQLCASAHLGCTRAAGASSTVYQNVVIFYTGDVFEYGTHVYVDLKKFYSTPYGQTTVPSTKDLYFWIRFGGFGSATGPGEGFSGRDRP